MKRTLPVVAALGSMLWLSTVSALGLGEIDVRSRLNQRFVASIPLASLGMDEAETVRVTLANVAEFERAGIERSDYLTTLNFTVVTEGAPRIEISSAQVVREPFLNFLIDVRASSGRLLREYTVLLDPPNATSAGTAVPVRPQARPAPSQTEFYETAQEATQRPAPAPVLTPVEPAFEPVSPAVAPTTTEVANIEGTYGPVQSGETFWSIATRLRPGSTVTMDQMLLALYENNRAAFEGGINGLRRGATLTVPTIDSIRTVAPAAAKAEIARLRGLPAQRVATAPRPVVAPAVVESEPIAAPAPEPEPVAVQPIVVPAPPVAEAPAVAPTSESSVEPPSDLGTPTDAPAAEPSAEAASEVAAEPAAAVDVATAPAPTPVPEPEPAVQSAPEASSSLLETLLLPLLGGLLVLGGVGYLVSRILAKRRAEVPMEPLPVPRPKAAAPATAKLATPSRKLSAKEQLEQLQESFDEPSTPSAQPVTTPKTQQLPTTKPAATQQLETEQFNTQQLTTQQLSTQKLDAAAATQIFQPPPAEVPPPAEAVDFDLTGQFESQTVQINLDANDPLSEADFHLAYGLYDEAALLLKQASAKEPARTDLQIKLAETYFAAGKAQEFQQAAETLKPNLSAADWQKLAIMGQQLQPGNALFKTDAGTADVAMDLSFDELAAPPVATPPKAKAAAPKPAPAPVIDDGLDFSLEDLELATLDQGGSDGLAVAPDKGNALEFDLGDFDVAEAPKPAAAPPPAAASAPVVDDNALEFDLGQFDTPAPAAAAPAAPPPRAASAPAPLADADIDVDNFDFGEMPPDSSTISGDEAGTKLDLARAYVDMGDDDMARSLLSEVLEQGSDTQQQEARTLLGRLG